MFQLLSGNAFAESNGVVALSGEFLDGNILKISAEAKELSVPVTGIAFHLNFEKEKLSFLKYEPGEFLEKGGDPFYLVTQKEGEIIFGETLRRDDRFPVGGDKIADFYFQISEGKIFNFAFERGVVSLTDVVRQDLEEISWENFQIEKKSKNLIADYTKNLTIDAKTSGVDVKFIILSTFSFLLLFAIAFKKTHMKKI